MEEESKKRMEWGIENLKKCFVAPDKLSKSLLNDDLKFNTSMHYVATGIKMGLITEEEVYERITGKAKEINMIEELDKLVKQLEGDRCLL